MPVIYIMFEQPPTNSRLYPARGASGHMPFAGHRSQAEVIEDESRKAITRRLGR